MELLVAAIAVGITFFMIALNWKRILAGHDERKRRRQLREQIAIFNMTSLLMVDAAGPHLKFLHDEAVRTIERLDRGDVHADQVTGELRLLDVKRVI